MIRIRLLGLAAALVVAIGATAPRDALAQAYAGFVSGTNVLDNGDNAIDQRNAGAAVTLTSGSGTLMTVDRWQGLFAASSSGAGNPTVTQVAASAGLSGTNNCAVLPKEAKLAMSATPSTTVPAALQLIWQQQVDGGGLDDLNFGTASPLTLTYSFCAKSSVASSVLGVYLQNATSARAYVTTCTTSSVASTWAPCFGQIPGDTTGTWTLTPGSVGAIFGITAACGSTFQQTAGSWQGNNATCTSGQTQLTATASSTLEIAGLKLERGLSNTPFLADPPQFALLKARRFFRMTFPIGTAPAQNAGLAGAYCTDSQAAQPVTAMFVFDPPMFASPATVTTFDPSTGTANWRDVTGSADLAATVDPSTAKGASGVEIISAAASAAAHNVCIHASFDTGK